MSHVCDHLCLAAEEFRGRGVPSRMGYVAESMVDKLARVLLLKRTQLESSIFSLLSLSFLIIRYDQTELPSTTHYVGRTFCPSKPLHRASERCQIFHVAHHGKPTI
jgi:hypothetical protein